MEDTQGPGGSFIHSPTHLQNPHPFAHSLTHVHSIFLQLPAADLVLGPGETESKEGLVPTPREFTVRQRGQEVLREEVSPVCPGAGGGRGRRRKHP